MTLTPPTATLDDAPKTEPEQDRLGYDGFARRLAMTLSAIRAENGYVVGLQGPWGSGKSTVLNFVKSHLTSDAADPNLVVIDYSPWLISGHQDLISGFFKILAEAVDAADVRGETLKRKAKRFASSSADPVFKGIGEIAAALHPDIGMVVKPVASATGAALGRALASWANEPSLQAAYAKLTTALRADPRRFVVLIDDLDRLEPEEIKAIAQMVKSVGGLPHVTYVLAYDRAVVWPALDGARQGSGTRFYAEKIIQHEISLPVPSRGALLRLLDEHTSFLIADTPNNDRWNDLLRNGVNRWMRSVRDVVRLSNAVAFAGPALAGELDPQDLLAMEGLRLFDDAAFGWVRDHRDYLLGEGTFRFQRKEELQALVSRLHVLVDGPQKAEVIALLCTLFPTRSKELAGETRPVLGSSETFAAVSARRGIATPEGFDAYFSLSIAVTRVSAQDLAAFVAALSDQDTLSNLLGVYVTRKDEGGASLIAQFLEQVRFRFEIPGAPAPTEAVVAALFIAGGAIMRLDDQTSGFEQRPLRYYADLMETLLRRAGQAAAFQFLQSGFKDASPEIAADAVVERGREHGVFPSAGQHSQQMITREAVDILGVAALAKILAAKADGSLKEAARYWDILRVWKAYGDAAEARDWIREVATADGRDFSKIALGLLAYSVGTSGRGYFVNDRPKDDDFSLEELADLATQHLAKGDLSSEDQARLEALRTGIVQIISKESWSQTDAAAETA